MKTLSLLIRRPSLTAVVALALAGCASDGSLSGAPSGTAVIEDSVANVSGSAGDYFVLYGINGRQLTDALAGTDADPAWGRQVKQPQLTARRVPAQPARFTIVASALYGSSDQAFARPLYQVAGDLEFTPEAGATYIVRGHLDPKRSLIWLEDARTGAVVAGTFVPDGPTAVSLHHQQPATGL
jgi:hypothetical protein